MPSNKPAPLLRIFAAICYDSLLLFSVAFCYAGIYIAITHATGLIEYQEDFSVIPDSLLFELGLLVISGSFYIGFWKYGGQTLGMRAWRLKLVSTNGDSPTFQQCLIRLPCALGSFACFGIGYFWKWFDKDNATAHGRVSGTRMILLPKPEKEKSSSAPPIPRNL